MLLSQNSFQLQPLATAAAFSILMALVAGCGGQAADKSGSPSSSKSAGTGQSSATTPGSPLVVTDDRGHRVVLARPPRRIISLAPSNTETLYAIGAGDRIVADTTADTYPPAAVRLPKVGDFRPSAEAILSFKPDLVVAIGYNAKELLDALDRLHVPVFIADPKTVKGIEDTALALGRITGCSAGAQRVVAGMQQRILAVQVKYKHPGKRSTPNVKSMIEISSDPLIIAGQKTCMGDVLRLAGGENVAPATGPDYPRLSTESLLTLNPGAIFLTDPIVSLASLKQKPGWSKVQAVQTGMVFNINADLLNRPSPRMVEALEQIANALHSMPHRRS